MGRLALEKPESRGLIADWKKQPGMLGMRFTFHTDLQKPWLTDGTADWLWPAAEKAGIPLMIFVPGSVPAVDAIAAKHPGLKLVLDHLAIGGEKRDAAAFEHVPDLVKLAKRPNVAVKSSALPVYSTEPYPFRALHEPLRKIFDAYGPKRIFWGTDWTRLPCPYRQAVTMFTEELPWLKGADLEGVMGRGIAEWLGWPEAK
jgi:predicted TIM-barrel fold metal-dependent hydrolase